MYNVYRRTAKTSPENSPYMYFNNAIASSIFDFLKFLK